MDIIDSLVGNEYVCGDASENIEIPSIVSFFNGDKAIAMLHNHVNSSRRVMYHCDVDFDGVACGVIFNSFCERNGMKTRNIPVINAKREHGITERILAAIDKYSIGLLVVLDSSTNSIDIIKKANCDVLVIDHHNIEIEQSEMSGETQNGEYVIVNNLAGDNPIKDMSAAMVEYELMRVYYDTHSNEEILKESKMYQWAALSLYTDIICINTLRNQWYVSNTIGNSDIEPSLGIMLQAANKYDYSLTKHNINFKLAPLINKAVRAGASAKALEIVLKYPASFGELVEYNGMQQKALEELYDGTEDTGCCICKDVTSSPSKKNYHGVIATKICSEMYRNAFVYSVDNGVAIGSFRGRLKNVDYRKAVENKELGITAEGHGVAFGIKCRTEYLDKVLASVRSIEECDKQIADICFGGIGVECKHRICDVDSFKTSGLLWKLAIANSRLSSKEEIKIVASVGELKEIEVNGGVILYDLMGIKCKAFENLKETCSSGLVELYAENSKFMDVYVKSINSWRY